MYLKTVNFSGGHLGSHACVCELHECTHKHTCDPPSSHTHSRTHTDTHMHIIIRTHALTHSITHV